MKLGVNIDHVATLRQARHTKYPSPLAAAELCMKAGADGITAHLREDRRHIQDRDMEALSKAVPRLNMEMAVTDDLEDVERFIWKHKPDSYFRGSTYERKK